VKGLDEDEGGFGSKLEIGKTGATQGEKVATAEIFYRGEYSLENFALLDPAVLYWTEFFMRPSGPRGDSTDQGWLVQSASNEAGSYRIHSNRIVASIVCLFFHAVRFESVWVHFDVDDNGATDISDTLFGLPLEFSWEAYVRDVFYFLVMSWHCCLCIPMPGAERFALDYRWNTCDLIQKSAHHHEVCLSYHL
jgi:hypothetical protein